MPYGGDLFGEIQLSESVAEPTPRYTIIPGLAICAVASAAAAWLSDHYGIPIILLGLLIGLSLNFVAREPRTHKGLDFASRTCLRWGIVDVGGWDTHVNQGGSQGYLATHIGELGRGLAGFADEIGPDAWRNTTVVVVSEFGRTFHENGGKGTDHGHGSIYWVMGGGVNGGRIAGPQTALSQATLNQGRDLPVLTDYRSMIGGLAAGQFGLGADRLATVFPSAKPVNLSLV